MTAPYRAMCAELTDAELANAARKALGEPSYATELHYFLSEDSNEYEPLMLAIRAGIAADRARALLAQPEPVGPTDEELDELYFDIDAKHVASWRHYARAALAKWGHLTPQPVWADIHYAWELEDAEGEWQAGGSANSLEDVQREGNRYLQTYEQDGPHKLIIQRHCVNTIEEVTND